MPFMDPAVTLPSTELQPAVNNQEVMMTTIIWKTCRKHGTSKSRYKARRAEAEALRQRDRRLASKIAKELTGCNQRVMKSVRDE